MKGWPVLLARGSEGSKGQTPLDTIVAEAQEMLHNVLAGSSSGLGINRRRMRWHGVWSWS
jgi:hypothetical protein